MNVVHLEHHFPLESAVAKTLADYVEYGSSLAGASTADVVNVIREQWAFPDLPHLQTLTDAICDKSLVCTSQYENDFFFTFHDDGGFPLSLPMRDSPPVPFLADVKAPGFSDFMCRFGGLIDGHLPPGACVLSPESSAVVEQETEDFTPDFMWGEVGLWEGARTFWHSGSGNLLLIHQSGQLGRWFHEIGWSHDDEIAVNSIDMSFPELIQDFAKYLSTPFDDRDMYSIWT
jgi:hypothetical protein